MASLIRRKCLPMTVARRTYSTTTPTISIPDPKKITVIWSSGSPSTYHNIWLRELSLSMFRMFPSDNQAAAVQYLLREPSLTFRAVTTAEAEIRQIPPDVSAENVQAKDEGLSVSWSQSPNLPSHTSLYPWKWLTANSYDSPASLRRSQVSKKVLWGSEIQSSPPTVSFSSTSSEEGLYRWLTNIDTYGFCFVSDVQVTPEATEELARRIGFIKETQYGTFWDFTSDLAKGDTAYTSLALAAHTDNTYFTDPAGLQLFHLLSHTHGTGGHTLLVDGFHAASLFRASDPGAYKMLSSVPVPAHAAGEPGLLYRPTPVLGYPVLRHNYDWSADGEAGGGELAQVRWNSDDRSAVRHVRGDDMERWYEALRSFNTILTSPKSEFWTQLKPGTAVVIDNHRVLHGRSAFTGKRRMCGAYIGVDEFRAKLAYLEGKYGSGNGDGRDGEADVWSSMF